MVPVSFPLSIYGYPIDYTKTAQENIDAYFKERLAVERRAARGKLLSAIDEQYESHKTGIGVSLAFIVFGGLPFYGSVGEYEYKKEDFLLSIGYIVVGIAGLVYSYGKIKTQQRLTTKIEQSEAYKKVVAFFTARWLSMECKSMIEMLEQGQKRTQQLHEDYWVERTKNEAEYEGFVPLGIGKQIQKIKDLAQTLEAIHGVLQKALDQLLVHQQTYAPNLNQEKAFYFSKANVLTSLAKEASKVQTSAEAEQVLQKLLEVVKEDELYS